MQRLRVVLTVLVLVLLPVTASAADPKAVEAKLGMVVAGEEHAVRAGVEILEAGGNAIDAAVAVGFALAVTLPEAGNLGGGGFLVASVLVDGKREEIAFDFREVAPSSAHANLYVDARIRGIENPSTVGALAAGVPGSVAGLLEALDRWGTLERKVVMAPAIRLAKNGYPIAAPTAKLFRAKQVSMKSFPSTLACFYPGGKLIVAGQRLTQPDLAVTLERIAELGRAGFYQGPVANLIVETMEKHGGIVTLEDLRDYQPRRRKPIRFEYRNHTIVSMPPPSSGGVCLQQILGMLEPHDLAEYGHNSSRSLHLLAESMRRSFADRNRFLGDPDHHELPLDRLLSREHIRELGRAIDLDHATPSSKLLGTGKAPNEREETTHYSIVDRHRNAVAVTTTLNGAFGSQLVVAGAGFLLNNEMDDFTAEPGKPNLYGLIQGSTNAVVAGARPLSSMTPTIVLSSDGSPVHVLGSPGGPTIITNVAQVIVNLLDFHLPAQAAVNAPKIHHQCLPDQIFYEPEFPQDVIDALYARGHKTWRRPWIGDMQLITIDKSTLKGAADPRRGGIAIGH